VRLRKASSFSHSSGRTALGHMVLRGSLPKVHLPLLPPAVSSTRFTLRLQRESPSRSECPAIRREQSKTCAFSRAFFDFRAFRAAIKKAPGAICQFSVERGEYPHRPNRRGESPFPSKCLVDRLHVGDDPPDVRPAIKAIVVNGSLLAGPGRRHVANYFNGCK
jgi:hypothetical protein